MNRTIVFQVKKKSMHSNKKYHNIISDKTRIKCNLEILESSTKEHLITPRLYMI